MQRALLLLGELPIRPGDAYPSPFPTGSVRSIPSSSPSSETPRNSDASSDTSTNPTSNDPTPIVEAQGWVTPATCHGS